MHYVIHWFVSPSGLITVFLAATFISFLIPRYRKLSTVLAATASMLFLVFSSSLTVQWLMGGLEYQYPPMQDTAENAGVGTLVVLTGFATNDPSRPLTGQLNAASGMRVLEAVRLYKRHTGIRVFISGGPVTASAMRDVMLAMGVPEKAIELEGSSSTTYDSAFHLGPKLAGNQFFLVTSAGHMPRSMKAFRAQGLHPVPAPTDYLSASAEHSIGWLPEARNLQRSDLAVHEYLGMFWYWLTGRL